MIDTSMTGKGDPYWRKALLFAKIMNRLEAGRATTRDARVIRQLLDNRGVTNRLIWQALRALKARIKMKKREHQLEYT